MRCVLNLPRRRPRAIGVRYATRCGLPAARERRPRRALYHAALVVEVDGSGYAIEVAPWSDGGVAGGAVGARWAGRWRLFRYEVRCRRGGAIPDLAYAVGGARRLAGDPRAVLGLVPEVPTPVWGRDELGLGEMWNSNSMVSWVLTRAGVRAPAPPPGGRAPGWAAGIDRARVASSCACTTPP